jgi:Flp pilus assembly protein TadG
MSRSDIRASHGRGQALVLFALALTALVGLTGLVIDGSSTYVQRRGMQNAADLAAMAAGYAYLNGTSMTTAADNVAAANGYTNGTHQTSVAVSSNALNGNTAEQITVSVTAPHQNWFSGIFGMSSWNVGATATVLAGIPNQSAGGALPLIFNQDLFSTSGIDPFSTLTYNEPPTGSQSVPYDTQQASYFEFNWTVFCQANGNNCNANSDVVDGLLTGSLPVTQTIINFDTNIDPLNAGSHTKLFSPLAALVPGCYPVAIVSGTTTANLQGFGTFCLTSSVGGSTKQIAGSFLNQVLGQGQGLTIAPGGGTPHFFGVYAVYLTN